MADVEASVEVDAETGCTDTETARVDRKFGVLSGS